MVKSRTGSFGSLVFALVVVATAVSAQAEAQSTDANDALARERHQAAVVAFDAGSYEAALDLFRGAYELSPRPQLLYNIGTTADRLRRNVEAVEAFEAYLEQAPDASNAESVRRRIEVLREEIARQRALEEAAAAAAATNAPDEASESRRRRRRVVGGVIGAVLAVGGGVALAIGLSQRGGSSYQAPEHDFVIQTLGGRR
jgi:tetratricopeptide (TPR) repeat protein